MDLMNYEIVRRVADLSSWRDRLDQQKKGDKESKLKNKDKLLGFVCLLVYWEFLYRHIYAKYYIYGS